jgi:uncharacterized protein YhaN
VKIQEIFVERFGAWRDLKLPALGEDLTVVYGPNEAGKTTLMQFVRATLFGFAPPIRQRYWPLSGEGPLAGSLAIDAAGESLRVARRLDSRDGEEVLTVDGVAAAGPPERDLAALVGGIDEAVYRNVFAIGIGELQYLGALTDTAAAAWLFRLTAGIDRVSLSDVMRELKTSLDRLFSDAGRPSQVSQWLADRERLKREIQQLSISAWDWARLGAERRAIETQIAEMEAGEVDGKREMRRIEAAMAAHGPWRRREELRQELSKLEPCDDEAALRAVQWDDLRDRQKGRRRLERRAAKRSGEFAKKAAGVRVNRVLVQEASRIEALVEQVAWLERREVEIDRLGREIASAGDSVAVESDRGGASPASRLDPAVWKSLRGPGRALRAARREWDVARGEAAAKQREAEIATTEMAPLQNSGFRGDLQAELDRAGDEAARLRRHWQIDQQLEKLEERRRELQDQGGVLAEKQLVSGWVLVALGTMFALGVAMVLAGLALPSQWIGPMGGVLVFFGIGGTLAAGVTKFLLDRASAQKLEVAQSQLEMLERQASQLEQERREIADALPAGGGPIAVRLKASQQELTELQRLLPIEARLAAAKRLADVAQLAAGEREADCQAADDRWQRALAACGLPVDLTPADVKALARDAASRADLDGVSRRKRAELETLEAEIQPVAARIDRWIREAGLTEMAEGRTLAGCLRMLAAEVSASVAMHRTRKRLLAKAGSWKRRTEKQATRCKALARKRRSILRTAGVESVDALRAAAQRAAHALSLRESIDVLGGEMVDAIGGHLTDAEAAELLAKSTLEQLESQWESRAASFEASAQSLKTSAQRLGAIGEQLSRLSQDRRLAELQLDLGIVQQRLQTAAGTWQVRAGLWTLLDEIRRDYQQNRQPETLLAASNYLGELTEGRYRRVWTPIDEPVLYVDDERGSPLPVDALSRGTREQLFLSLRLALVEMYARRGVELPIVLDDVLVNYDARRAKAAARVLRDFARSGRQMLVFTCHDHVVKSFKAAKVDVVRLPGERVAEPAVDNGAVAPRSTRKTAPRHELEPPRSTPSEPVPSELRPPRFTVQPPTAIAFRDWMSSTELAIADTDFAEEIRSNDVGETLHVAETYPPDPADVPAPIGETSVLDDPSAVEVDVPGTPGDPTPFHLHRPSLQIDAEETVAEEMLSIETDEKSSAMEDDSDGEVVEADDAADAISVFRHDAATSPDRSNVPDQRDWEFLDDWDAQVEESRDGADVYSAEGYWDEYAPVDDDEDVA